MPQSMRERDRVVGVEASYICAHGRPALNMHETGQSGGAVRIEISRNLPYEESASGASNVPETESDTEIYYK